MIELFEIIVLLHVGSSKCILEGSDTGLTTSLERLSNIAVGNIV